MNQNQQKDNHLSVRQRQLKPVLSHGNNENLKSSKVSSIKQPLSESNTIDMWGRMTVLYGYKWSSNLGMAVDDDGYLTVAAKIWAEELAGISTEQLLHGFSRLKISFPSWPPTVFEFSRLCKGGNASEIPTLDQMASILGTVSARTGSVEHRYKYSMALEIAKKVDMYNIRMMSTEQIKSVIRPIYERLLNSGWDDFEPFASQEQKAVGHDRTSA